MKELLIGQLGFIGTSAIVSIIATIGVFIIKKTKTKKDDEFVEKYLKVIVKCIDIAVEIAPKGKTLDAVKLAKNGIKKFNEILESTENEIDPKYSKLAKDLIKTLSEERAKNNIAEGDIKK